MREEIKDTFDELSPITGELSVLVEDNFRLDLGTGYQNVKDVWVNTNPEEIVKVESGLPDYIISLKFEDKATGNIWYPMIAFKHNAALYPLKINDSYVWIISKVSKLENEEELKTHSTINLPITVNGKEEIAVFKIENEPYKAYEKNDFEFAYEDYSIL